MVTEEEIERVSKLMKIDVDDHKEYVDKVQSMINYFDILDSAGVESEEITMHEIPVSSLREDEHIPFNGKLIEKLNPTHEAGKVVIISRFGKDKIEEQLPPLIRAIRREGFPVVWSSDPMHGNTFSTEDSIKTRNFDHILEEIKSSFAIHRAEGSYLGGVHLEMTGDNVTECVGGAEGLNESGLGHNYETFCDPRLNYQQSLELAFLIAKEWKQSYL